jgi:oxygen-independent coproporphyrinogen-3 oxidase
MTPELIRRHAAPLPRYTSYPTANHFTGEIGPSHYRDWLAQLSAGSTLSLYVHIPYCRQLCWYCGCSTKAVRRYEPVAGYVDFLAREIGTVATLAPSGHRVSHIHWGGGSPDILADGDIGRLADVLRRHFNLAEDAEFAVEIDPRLLTENQANVFAEAGVNRISIGVQDFDPAVQQAIGRTQSYELTLRTIELFRARGIGSVNIDLVYGLPHQTEASVAQTIERVLALAPDRIAVFGYAHLPTRLKHQRLIDEAALPGPVERHRQARRLEDILTGAGFAKIGLDHFARPSDSLAQRPLARNFQGYTTDDADALLAFGASAISKLPQGFAQNAAAVEEYGRRLAAHGLATARGRALSGEDRIRAHAIERLMCDFSFSASDMRARYGNGARSVIEIAQAVMRTDMDGFVERAADGFRITGEGRPFVRNICAKFDAYLADDAAERRHALSV